MRDALLIVTCTLLFCVCVSVAFLTLTAPPTRPGPIVIPPCDQAHLGFRVTTKPFEEPMTRLVCTGEGWALDHGQDPVDPR